MIMPYVLISDKVACCSFLAHVGKKNLKNHLRHSGQVSDYLKRNLKRRPCYAIYAPLLMDTLWFCFNTLLVSLRPLCQMLQEK